MQIKHKRKCLSHDLVLRDLRERIFLPHCANPETNYLNIFQTLSIIHTRFFFNVRKIMRRIIGKAVTFFAQLLKALLVTCNICLLNRDVIFHFSLNNYVFPFIGQI